MSYCLCKLAFSGAFHTGDAESAKSLDTGRMCFCADTLFSALCCTARLHYGADAAGELCDLASSGSFIISDTMPYHKDTLFLPRPVMLSTVHKEESTKSSDRKAFKKLGYIPVESFSDYIAYAEGNGSFSPKDIFADFGISEVHEKVSIKGLELPSPYSVGTFAFNEDCGLYFVLSCPDEDIINGDFLSYLELLGLDGIGGKVSSGYGRFTLSEDIIMMSCRDDCYEEQLELLFDMLEKNSGRFMSLTTSLPKDDELDMALKDAFYTVRRRGGFVQSEDFGGTLKKDTQFFLQSGSVFSSRYEGDIYNVARGGSHPVFRYSKPLFLGF